MNTDLLLCIMSILGTLAACFCTLDVYRDQQAILGIPNWVFRILLPYSVVRLCICAVTYGLLFMRGG